MSVKIITHVITLGLHVSTHLVETRCRNKVALAVNLPGNGRVLGANFVVTACSCGRSSVHSNIRSLFTIDNHTAYEVGVVVFFVIHNGEYLCLHTDLCGSIHENTIPTENTIIEWSLILIESSASTGSRVRPVNFVSLSNLHTNTVLPDERSDKLVVFFIVIFALESSTDIRDSKLTVKANSGELRTSSSLVVFSERVVLGSKMPVNIHRAHTVLPVRSLDRFDIDLHVSLVTLGDIGTSLRQNIVDSVSDTLYILKLDLFSITWVRSCRWLA
mmetsp:Transcript_5435/g.7706  ORF Transcript_5435/g.7706 Transcript_5435/m.7706 type:complete len:273 (+) Transcript_5435:155-973(+)